MTAPRTIVATPEAPGAIGPYSQAVVHAGLLWCSGAIPLDPADGSLVTGSVAAETTRVLPGDDGAVDSFVIRAPWGGGATVARSADAALRIVTARRRAAGPEGRVRVGLTDENAEGLARLAEVGLRLMWSAPRMVRGEALAWRPEMIYGQFNHAMG